MPEVASDPYAKPGDTYYGAVEFYPNDPASLWHPDNIERFGRPTSPANMIPFERSPFYVGPSGIPNDPGQFPAPGVGGERGGGTNPLLEGVAQFVRAAVERGDLIDYTQRAPEVGTRNQPGNTEQGTRGRVDEVDQSQRLTGNGWQPGKGLPSLTWLLLLLLVLLLVATK